MNSEDFTDWKRHPITQELFSHIRWNIQTGMEELAGTAGEDPILDARRSGKIIALNDFLNISFEDVRVEEQE